MSLGYECDELRIGRLFGGRISSDCKASAALAAGDIGIDYQRYTPLIAAGVTAL